MDDDKGLTLSHLSRFDRTMVRTCYRELRKGYGWSRQSARLYTINLIVDMVGDRLKPGA